MSKVNNLSQDKLAEDQREAQYKAEGKAWEHAATLRLDRDSCYNWVEENWGDFIDKKDRDLFE